jgi:hypothetical protein
VPVGARKFWVLEKGKTGCEALELGINGGVAWGMGNTKSANYDGPEPLVLCFLYERVVSSCCEPLVLILPAYGRACLVWFGCFSLIFFIVSEVVYIDSVYCSAETWAEGGAMREL